MVPGFVWIILFLIPAAHRARARVRDAPADPDGGVWHDAPPQEPHLEENVAGGS